MCALVPALLVTIACTGPDEAADGPSPTSPTEDSPTLPLPTDTGPTGPTGGDTGATGEPTAEDTGLLPWERPVDCSGLAPLPPPYTTLSWAPPNEDYTFGADGYAYAINNGLTRTPYGGPSELLVPGIPAARGTRFLPDGTLIVALVDTGTLIRVDPNTGGQSVVASGLVNPNGIAIGPDGRAYVATGGRILRVDPDSLAVDVFVEEPGSFDGITFSHDYRRLYWNEETGAVHWVDLDEDLEVVGSMHTARIPVGFFSLLDGMAADACGHLYVIEMGGILWRISPDGTVEEALRIASAFAVTPSLNFGLTSAGGYDPNVLYIADFTGKFYAVEVGVPGKWEPHLP